MEYRRLPNLEGRIIQVTKIDKPPVFRKRAITSEACKAGLRYERKIIQRLREVYKDDILIKPWYSYSYYADNGRIVDTVCSPDAIIFNRNKNQIILVEIKIRLTAIAYYQLKNLYYPILRVFYGGSFYYNFLNIIKWFDPNGMEDVKDWRMLKNIADLSPRLTDMAVHIWH